MRLITFIAATLGAIGHCEGAAVPDGDSAPVLATRYPSDCKLTNACLRSLFDEPLKAEYICKKLLHRPQIVKTTKYIPVLVCETYDQPCLGINVENTDNKNFYSYEVFCIHKNVGSLLDLYF